MKTDLEKITDISGRRTAAPRRPREGARASPRRATERGRAYTDKELWEKCRQYGTNARTWAKKFATLLPEVERRELYKRHGFYSIFEFAAKLAGMGRETVVEILRVARRLEDKPALLAEMETQGWAKLRLVATVATKENEAMWIEKVREMSKPTLETFVHELRKQNHELVQNRPGTATHEQSECAFPADGAEYSGKELIQAASSEPQNSGRPPRITVRMPLKPHTELRLRKLQKKLSQAAKAPVDLNEVMETLLDAYEKLQKRPNKKILRGAQDDRKRVQKITKTEEKSEITAAKQQIQRELPQISSRYIPAKVKHLLDEEYGGRCAYPDCQNLPEIYHHTRRYALYPNHNPDFLAPLCKNHERLAHHGLIENEEEAPSEWRVQTEADETAPKFAIDAAVNTFRRPASEHLFVRKFPG